MWPSLDACMLGRGGRGRDGKREGEGGEVCGGGEKEREREISCSFAFFSFHKGINPIMRAPPNLTLISS